MITEHMKLLNVWRTEVVRDGKRVYVAPNGEKYEMSLRERVFQVPFEQSGVLRQVSRLCRAGEGELTPTASVVTLFQARKSLAPRQSLWSKGEQVMETSRRNILKIGGLCALGLGFCRSGRSVCQIGQTPKFLTNLKAGAYRQQMGHGDRYEKMLGKRRQSGCKDCMLACHLAHNVPDIPDRKAGDQVDLERKVRNRLSRRRKAPCNPKKIREKPFMVLCNHCSECSLREGVPHQGHLQKPRRDHHDGLPPLHRVPVLHGRLSLRRQEF